MCGQRGHCIKAVKMNHSIPQKYEGSVRVLKSTPHIPGGMSQWCHFVVQVSTMISNYQFYGLNWLFVLPRYRLGRGRLTTCNFLLSHILVDSGRTVNLLPLSPRVSIFAHKQTGLFMCCTVCVFVFASIWESRCLNIQYFFPPSVSLSSLILSQWYTVQHCPLRKMVFSSKTYVTTTSMQPAECDASQILTSRVPASDCAKLTALGQGPLPAAWVRWKYTWCIKWNYHKWMCTWLLRCLQVQKLQKSFVHTAFKMLLLINPFIIG